MDIKSLLFNIFFLFLCLCTLFVTSFHFVDKEVLSKWYALYFLTLLACVFFCITTRSIHFKIDKVTIILLLFIGYLLISSLFSLTYEKSIVFQCVEFLLLFLLFKSSIKHARTITSIIIVGACILQAIYGILQFTKIISINSIFAVVGSFDNPAGFAACVSSGYAFCFTLFNKKRYMNYIAIVAMLIIGTSVILSQSRAGMLSIFILTAIFFYHNFNYKLSRKCKIWILIGFLIATVVLITYLFLFKKNSATGRFLIWKATINMIIEKPVLGWGSDSFRSQYMLHQAEYFKKHPNSKYEILADNVVHPFNEYLRLTVEYGIVGLISLLLFIFTIYSKRNKEDVIFKLSILSILIFACFSYPLRYPFIWLILAYNLSNISQNSIEIYYRWNSNFILILKVGVIFILFLYCYCLMKNIEFEYKWKNVSHSFFEDKSKTIIFNYEKLEEQWNGNPLFLYNYGAKLNYIKQYDKSVLILHKCEKYYNDYDVQLLMADNYYNMKQWEKSETCYTNAYQMCPNRFLPLDGLMNIYDSIGQEDKIIKIAHIILNKPVKIKSSTIFKIKFKARRRLKNIESEK